MKEIQIREIDSAEELIKVQSIAAEVWEPTYRSIISQDQLEFMFEKMYSLVALEEQLSQGHRFLIGESEQLVCGFCSFVWDGDYVRVPKLYVSLAHQKKGIGKILLEQVEAIGKEMNKLGIRLNVNRNNPAFEFYKKSGFLIESVVDIPYYQFVLNDYVMLKMIE